jgi:hypothetical protein
VVQVVDEVGQGVKINNAYCIFILWKIILGRISARNDSFEENHR